MMTDIDLVSSLHTSQAVQSGSLTDDERCELVFALLVIAASIATFQNFVNGILKALFPNQFRSKRKEALKASYRFTNLTVNACLGIWGLYIYFTSVPDLSTTPITDRISAFPQFSYFGAAQVGYNIWALLIGFFFLDEEPSMIAHHIAVLCVGSLSCFRQNGFRYHAPFFFGAIEISSVPLSIMNFCKDNADWMPQKYPKLNACIRPLFAIIFLIVRVLMWVPQIADVLYIVGLLGLSCDSNLCRLSMGSFWFSAAFLTLLQLYWAYLICSGIFKMLTVKQKKVD